MGSDTAPVLFKQFQRKSSKQSNLDDYDEDDEDFADYDDDIIETNALLVDSKFDHWYGETVPEVVTINNSDRLELFTAFLILFNDLHMISRMLLYTSQLSLKLSRMQFYL